MPLTLLEAQSVLEERMLQTARRVHHLALGDPLPRRTNGSRSPNGGKGCLGRSRCAKPLIALQ